MKNQEIKQQLIKQHWENAGFDWEQISKIVDDAGQLLIPISWEFMSIKGFAKAEKECLTVGTGVDSNKNYVVKLLSLHGIENNNGWTRIEADGSNLPTKGAFKVWCDDRDKIFASTQTEFDSDEVAELFYDFGITHFRPVVKDPNPIY